MLQDSLAAANPQNSAHRQKANASTSREAGAHAKDQA